jgi:hypothetical protein
MNASKLLIAVAIANLSAVGASAGEVDLTPLPEFHSVRSVAEVRAEATEAAAHPVYGEWGQFAATPESHSTLTRAAVIEETAVAQRAGLIPHGEASLTAALPMPRTMGRRVVSAKPDVAQGSDSFAPQDAVGMN